MCRGPGGSGMPESMERPAVAKRWRSYVKCVVVGLLASLLIALILIKSKTIFINPWFVDESTSVIGADVSMHQGTIDMRRLKEQDIAFVFIKATEGSGFQDVHFAENWANAQQAGLPCGAYHFFSFDSPGVTQAENFIRTVGPEMEGHLPPAVDVEFYGDKLENPPARADVVRELASMLDALVVTDAANTDIYTGTGFYKEYLQGDFDDYRYWMSSRYVPLSWEYDGTWCIWQYLSRAELDGYSGGTPYIDLNVLNEDTSLEDLLVPVNS